MTLSIITINYNNADGLRRTAESVKAQTCKDFEWIVIDGGSTDGGKEVIEQYKHLMSHWMSERDRGIYNAMNKGIDAAKGDYLLFLNSGDALYDSDVVADFYRRDNTEDVIYGREIGVTPEGRVDWDWQLPEEPLRLSFFWYHTLKHQATFFSKRCFERFRYNESHKINSDVELYMSLLYHGYKFASYDRYIAKFDTGGVSTLANLEGKGKVEFNDTISRLMPPGMIQDYEDLVQCQEVDVIRMSRDIANSSRLLRGLLRLMIRPLHMLSKKSK